ncbi:uncharacterized protein G2W53_024042 [Senna tora]|uniref:Uncharacterized protein n=1 Tax=Senna tora TaxID=362788 RepID=A0A834WDJ0_9FABA|nr:uncharacterized protein G2W53_024042 [Senna tora]
MEMEVPQEKPKWQISNNLFTFQSVPYDHLPLSTEERNKKIRT